MPAHLPGSVVAFRYLYPDGRVQAVLPLRTVADDGETYVGWTPPGTEIRYWATADGADPRTVPIDRRFRQPLTTASRVWRGTGALRVIPRSASFHVIHFWDDERRFHEWYVNLETPKVEHDDLLDTVDSHLDLIVFADGSLRWKDEDEADAAIAAGAMEQRVLDEAWVTGRAVEALLPTWPAPIGDWRDFTPSAAQQEPIPFDPRWLVVKS
ncbi:DUF402 domain-containing protein [Jatrophihabitans sp. YIM 134969]